MIMGSKAIPVPKKKGEGELPMYPPGAKPLKVSGTGAIVNEITDFFITGYFAEGKKLSMLENRYGKQFVELHEERQALNKEARSTKYTKGDKESRAAFDEKMEEINTRQAKLDKKQVNLETDFLTELGGNFPFLMYKNINLSGSAIAKNKENGKYRILDRKKSSKNMKKIVAKSVSDILSYGGKVSAAAKATQKNFEKGNTNAVYIGMGGGPVDVGVLGSSENVAKFNTALSNRLIQGLSEPLKAQGIDLQPKGFQQTRVFLSALSPPTEFQKERKG